jgi:regulator of protease activity HflC (stomatin/prohibitin superfamily)
MAENEEKVETTKAMTMAERLELKVKEMEEARKKDLDDLKEKFKKTRSIAFITLLVTVALFLFHYFLVKIGLVDPNLWVKFVLWASFLLSLVALYLSKALKLLREFEKGLIERFRRYRRTEDPGIKIIFYPFERIKFIQIWEQRIDIPPQDAVTKDPFTIKINAIVWFRILHPYGAEYNIRDLYGSILELMKAGLRNAVGELKIKNLLISREDISEKLRTIIEEEANKDEKKDNKDEEKIDESTPDKEDKYRDEKLRPVLDFFKGRKSKTKEWGIKITRVEIQEIELPENVEGALERKFAAAQDKDAEILRADGESKGILKVKKSLKEGEGTEQFIGLRFIETLPENSKYFFDLDKIPLVGKLFKDISK